MDETVTPLSLRGLVDALSLSLADARHRVDTDSGALARYIRIAVADLHRVRPRVRRTSVVLAAGVACYPLPDDAVGFHSAGWVSRFLDMPPWDRQGVHLPTPRVAIADGAPALALDPAPSRVLVALLPGPHSVHYTAQHAVGAEAAQTSVRPEDRYLVILRAQAEAMREVALNNAGKPGHWKGGDASMARNSTPSAVYQQLMAAFERS